MLKLLVISAAVLALAGCMSREGGSASSGLGDVSGGFSRSADTQGTQRRLDVYGGATSPVLPTMGQPGFGK